MSGFGNCKRIAVHCKQVSGHCVHFGTVPAGDIGLLFWARRCYTRCGMKSKGIVHLVGAPSGDAGFLTLRGAELLKQAGVVLHEGQACLEWLRLAPAAARVFGPAGAGQPAHLELARSHALEGRLVVWLRPDDLAGPGRAAEDLRALKAGGIRYGVTPGVSDGAVAVARQAAPAGGSLQGRRVVVTRSREQAGEMSRLLRERGAEALEVPVIKLGPPSEREPLIEALLGLNAYDWLIFTSVNGVSQFFDYFFKSFPDLRDIGGVRIAAVGPATAARIQEFHLKVDVMPEEAVASRIVKAIDAYETVENLRFCLFRAEVASRELPLLLEEAGGIVDDVAVYRTELETEDPCGAGADLVSRGADWITFTSGSTVENFHRRFDLPGLLARYPAMRIASIGPETSKALAALKLVPAVEPREHTVEALVRAVEKASAGAA